MIKLLLAVLTITGAIQTPLALEEQICDDESNILYCTKVDAENIVLSSPNQGLATENVNYTEMDAVSGNIEENAAALFPKLETLLIQRSNITHFALHSNITHLHVVETHFPNLTDNVLGGLTNIRSLDFISNPDVVFEAAEPFKDLKQLEMISIINQTIPRLTRKLFNGATALKQLNLILDGITDIDNDTFTDLVQLENLNLDDNPIAVLQIGTFQPLVNLKILSLISTNLQQLDSAIFMPLTALTTLGMPTKVLASTNATELLELFPKLENVGVDGDDDLCPAVLPNLVELEGAVMIARLPVTPHIQGNYKRVPFC